LWTAAFGTVVRCMALARRQTAHSGRRKLDRNVARDRAVDAALTAVVRPAESNIDLQPQRAQPPALDSLEVSLLATFLRRYVTYCARRRRFAAMNGRPNYVSDVVADR
jgi:hypothetical protein